MPNTNEIYYLCELINEKYKAIDNVWGTMDGLHIDLEVCSNHPKQSMFYNNWKYCHYVTNLFLFTPNGKIATCFFNCPQIIHD